MAEQTACITRESVTVSDSISVAEVASDPMLPATGSSFYTAMRVLPALQRQAMFGIYAFCRAVDDIADSDAPTAARRADLEHWRRDIDACYADNAPPRLLSLHRQILAFDLERDDFQAVIDGMMMDADAAICAPDAHTLEIYCDRVASAVGRLSVRVFGMQRDDGIALAHHLGRALQFTNILRDIDEDAGIGRVYLPREALLAAGVELGASAAIAAHPAIPAACASLVTQAQAHFQAAEAIMRRSPRRVVRAPRIMAAAYHAVLMRLLARGWARPRYPVKVPKLQRIGILLRFAFI
jgi:squalene synthase HpnD